MLSLLIVNNLSLTVNTDKIAYELYNFKMAQSENGPQGDNPQQVQGIEFYPRKFAFQGIKDMFNYSLNGTQHESPRVIEMSTMYRRDDAMRGRRIVIKPDTAEYIGTAPQNVRSNLLNVLTLAAMCADKVVIRNATPEEMERINNPQEKEVFDASTPVALFDEFIEYKASQE